MRGKPILKVLEKYLAANCASDKHNPGGQFEGFKRITVSRPHIFNATVTWEQRQSSEQTLYELAFIINRAYAHELMFTEDVQKQKRKLVAIWSTLLRDRSAQHSAFHRISLENKKRAGTHCVGSERRWSLVDTCRRNRWRYRPCRSRWCGIFLGYDKGLDGKDLHGRGRKMGHYSKRAPLLLCLM